MDAFMMLAATGEPTTWEWLLSRGWMILSVAVGLGFVIFVHELGHFLVAKACGVKCEKFYIGFDLFNLRFCRFKWGETEYGIGVLPLGGYVKMLGQDDDPRNAMAEADRCKVPPGESSEAARAAALAEGAAAEGLTPGATVEQQPTYELDPRSYPAKPVLARMAIISAGVIMNVIFGVFLAAWAYWMGVPISPAMVGTTVPGAPAWTHDLRPGMQFIRFGKSGATYDHYRFDDVKRTIIFNGSDRDLAFLVRDREGQEREFVLCPTDRNVEKTDFPTIGYVPPDSLVVLDGANRVTRLSAKTSPPLKDKDHVVAVDGVPLKTDKEGEVFDHRLNATLAQHPSGPLTLTVERMPEDKEGKPQKDATPQRMDVVIEAKPMRVIGVEMKIGPIVAVREGSPAQKAGFQVDDVIEKVNGEAVGDPLSLGQRLIPASDNETWTFVVARKGKQGKLERVELSVRPQLPDQFHDNFVLGGPTAVESIGVAFDVTREIAAVEPGSGADKEGLKPGDLVTKVRFVAASPDDQKAEEEVFDKEFNEEIELDGNFNSWTRIHWQLQQVLPSTKVKLTVLRDKKEITVTLAAADATAFFAENRGLNFYPLKVTHQARSIGEAFYLGGREVKERMVEVVATISQLLSRRVSPKHLSGPAGIIAAAGHFASQGLPTLLIFLTILSANLAVLNFLPIPVLDGGHMLFLAWEGITRKPVNPNVQGYLSLAGLLLLLLLMIYATKNDLTRFFS